MSAVCHPLDETETHKQAPHSFAAFSFLINAKGLCSVVARLIYPDGNSRIEITM